MPRREKDETVTDTETIEAPASAGGEGEAPAPKPDRPLGPMTTRTGAPALVIKAPKGQRVFTAGGDKGNKIAELLQTKPELSRKDIAGIVGCSQSRVAEVARVLGLSKSREEAAAANAAAAEAQPETVDA